jgi:predicted RNase H-like nuclease
MLTAEGWDAACAIGREVEGKAISKQAWGIFEKICEVDVLLSERPELQARVREVHPELCFWAWGGNVLQHSKKRVEGREQRKRLVETYFGKASFEDVRARFSRAEVGSDDILDAFAALWTAERILRREARWVPEELRTDTRGLRMEIVY